MSDVDPDVRKLLAAAQRSRAPGFAELGAVAARELFERTASVLELPRQPLALVDDWPVPLAGRTLQLRRYCPVEPSWTDLQPAMLYFHGGGFTIGSIRTHDHICRRLAHASGCIVASLDYRLAPEHRFPAAVDDAFETLAWLRAEAASLGIDADRLAVGGDSAGGTLAAATAIHARDAGWPLALQLLIYPGLAARQESDSHRQLGQGYLLEAEVIQWFFENYLRGDDDRFDWRFAPLIHPDLHGVAAAWIGLAGLDPLRDEGIAYHRRLEEAGVRSTLRVYEGVVHGFFHHGGLVRKARLAHDEAGLALREATKTA